MCIKNELPSWSKTVHRFLCLYSSTFQHLDLLRFLIFLRLVNLLLVDKRKRKSVNSSLETIVYNHAICVDGTPFTVFPLPYITLTHVQRQNLSLSGMKGAFDKGSHWNKLLHNNSVRHTTSLLDHNVPHGSISRYIPSCLELFQAV